MSTNYRLPLKHFEKKTWKESELYNYNLFRLKLWPSISILVLLSFLISFGIYMFNYQHTSYKDIILSKTSNPNQILASGCAIELNQESWKSKDCKNELVIDFKESFQEGYTKISNFPVFYIRLNQKEVTLINSSLLIEPVINSQSNYVSVSQITKFSDNSKFGVQGSCKMNEKCDLVSIEGNNLKLIKKNFIQDIINSNENRYFVLTQEVDKYYIELVGKEIVKLIYNPTQKTLTQV